MDFVRGKEIPFEPIDSSLRTSPKSSSNLKKRSMSFEVKRNDDIAVHNSDKHQNKRQKLLIKRTLLGSFISSINAKIDFKRPSLSIAIPTQLFFDQTSTDSAKQEGSY